MPVNIYPVQINVSDDVEDAILAELAANGITQGSLYIGASSTKPGDCCVMLVVADHAPYSAITSPQILTAAPAAVEFTRHFAHQWKLSGQGPA